MAVYTRSKIHITNYLLICVVELMYYQEYGNAWKIHSQSKHKANKQSIFDLKTWTRFSNFVILLISLETFSILVFMVLLVYIAVYTCIIYIIALLWNFQHFILSIVYINFQPVSCSTCSRSLRWRTVLCITFACLIPYGTIISDFSASQGHIPSGCMLLNHKFYIQKRRPNTTHSKAIIIVSCRKLTDK